MYGLPSPSLDAVILTDTLQLRLLQDLHGSADDGWNRRRQEEAVDGRHRQEILLNHSFIPRATG